MVNTTAQERWRRWARLESIRNLLFISLLPPWEVAGSFPIFTTLVLISGLSNSRTTKDVSEIEITGGQFVSPQILKQSGYLFVKCQNVKWKIYYLLYQREGIIDRGGEERRRKEDNNNNNARPSPVRPPRNMYILSRSGRGGTYVKVIRV